MRAWLVLTGILALAPFAGCVQPSALAPASDGMAGMAMGDSPLNVHMEKCNFGGGVAANPTPEGTPIGEPKPFVASDVTPFLGLPVNGSTTGVTSIGNAHVAFECESWMVNGHHKHMPNGGFVGLVVKPPPFANVTPAAHNLLLSMWGSRDDAFVSAVKGAGGNVFPAVGHVAFGNGIFQLDGWPVLEAVLDTSGDGVYTSELRLTPADSSWSLFRLWMVVDGQDGKMHPAFFDLALSGGETFYGQGYFSHGATPKHGPPGRGDSASGAIAFLGVDANLTMRTLPDEMEGMWMH